MIDFSPAQKKTIACGITILSLIVTFSFVAIVAWFLLMVISLASAAIAPVIFGFFLALFFKPYYNWWKRIVKNPTVALIVMLLTVLVPFNLILWYAGSILIDQASNLIAQGPQLVRQVGAWFSSTFPRLHQFLSQTGMANDNIADIVQRYGATAAEAGSGALKCITGVFTALLSLLFLVFFLMTKDRRGGEIVAQMPFLKDDTRKFLAAQIDAFVDILVSFFQRQTVICLLEGCMYGVGFAAVGLPYGFLIGFLLGILNLIPLFGTVVCLPIALPLAYFGSTGSTTRLILVLVVWLLGQILDGYVITPKIQGDKTGLGFAGVIFSFIFWPTILGPFLGLLLAIPLSAFCVVLWRALKSNYIRPFV